MKPHRRCCLLFQTLHIWTILTTLPPNFLSHNHNHLPLQSFSCFDAPTGYSNSLALILSSYFCYWLLTFLNYLFLSLSISFCILHFLSLSLSFCILHVLSLSIEPSIHQSKITIPSCTIPTECNKKKDPTFNFFTFCDCLSSPQGTKFLFLYLGWPNSQAVICTTASLQLTLVRSPSDWSFLPKNRIKQCKQIFVWICFYKMDHPWPLFH